MTPVRDEPRRRLLPGSVLAVGSGLLVASLSLVALDLEPAAAFWAVTAGLPLVAFVVLAVVTLARRAGRADDGSGDAR